MSRNDNAFELIKADGDGPESSGTIRGVELGARIRDPNAPFGPYLISEELATAANVALWLNQPLLLTGEAGVGKTSFAWALARKLGAEPLLVGAAMRSPAAGNQQWLHSGTPRRRSRALPTSSPKRSAPCRQQELQWQRSSSRWFSNSRLFFAWHGDRRFR